MNQRARANGETPASRNPTKVVLPLARVNRTLLAEAKHDGYRFAHVVFGDRHYTMDTTTGVMRRRSMPITPVETNRVKV